MAVNYLYPLSIHPTVETSKGIIQRRAIDKSSQATIEAFTEMYNNYVGKIYRYVLFRVGDEQIAEDLTSLVFMKAWESLEHFRPTGAQFITWLFTIAHNTIIDHYRTHKDTVALDTSIQEPGDRLSPEEESVSHFEKESLRKAIQKLTKEQQNVVILKFIEGLSTEEIASQLGKRAGTIRALQMRALQSLSRQMTETT